jgi:hypothetical protein
MFGWIPLALVLFRFLPPAVLRTKRSRRGVESHVEVRYFSVGLFAAPFHRMGTLAAARTAALLFAAQICNVLGFVYQRGLIVRK